MMAARVRTKRDWEETPALLVYLAAIVVSIWAWVITVSEGLTNPAVAWSFGMLIIVGEALRIDLRGAAGQAPIALAGGLGYALLAESAAGDGWAQVVAVSSLAMLIGAVPHALAGRDFWADSISRRIVLIATVALLFHLVMTEFAWSQHFADDLRLRALCMATVLAIGFMLSSVLDASQRAIACPGSFGHRLSNQIRDHVRLRMASLATAMVLAIATELVGAWAVPACAVPLLLTQLSYRRYQLARVTYAQAVDALSRATDMAGFTRPGHARRVADIAVGVGNEIGLRTEQMRQLEFAALLHDVGQMSLTEPLPSGATIFASYDERVAIATSGADLIADAGLPGDIATAVGRQVEPVRSGSDARHAAAPLMSRIINVANAFDDLTDAQPSQASAEQAVDRIRRGIADDYDPAVVEALARHVAHTHALVP
jgi:HD domain